jgi:hypothetical protein
MGMFCACLPALRTLWRNCRSSHLGQRIISTPRETHSDSAHSREICYRIACYPGGDLAQPQPGSDYSMEHLNPPECPRDARLKA